MESFKVALLQMTGCGVHPSENLAKGEAYCHKAKADGADLALFPEMWSVGYSTFDEIIPQARERWLAHATPEDGPFVQHFQRLARELDMAIAITYLEKTLFGPRNSVSLIDRRGRLLFTYAKVHTCDFVRHESACVPGDAFKTAELDTAAGPVSVGAMICFDREHPESARILMLQGAEIILTPNACILDEHRLTQFRTRAFENMTGVAMANYAAPDQDGHSVAYDGMSHDIKGRVRDMVLVEAGRREGVFIADFDIDTLREYRARDIHANAFRKPRCYDQLLSMDVQAPFVRTVSRR